MLWGPLYRASPLRPAWASSQHGFRWLVIDGPQEEYKAGKYTCCNLLKLGLCTDAVNPGSRGGQIDTNSWWANGVVIFQKMGYYCSIFANTIQRNEQKCPAHGRCPTNVGSHPSFSTQLFCLLLYTVHCLNMSFKFYPQCLAKSLPQKR